MPLNAPFLSSPLHLAGARPETRYALSATHSQAQWRLPSELFSIIFQHACLTQYIPIREAIRTPPFHLALRLVSRLWYNIVQSTPQLWAFVILPTLCADNVDVKGLFLKLCLDNSGCLPLTLSLRFDPGLRTVASFVSPVVDTTLEHNTHRIQTLELFQPPRSWLETLIPKMDQLDTIYFDNLQSKMAPPLPHRRDRRLVLPKSANLSQIRIRYPYLLEFCFECVTTSVTNVLLFDIPIDFAIEILLQCPNLIHFGCMFPETASQDKNPRTMLASPLVLSHLSSFTWSTTLDWEHQFGEHLSEWDCVLFEHIHFPNLETFWFVPTSPFLLNDPTLAPLLSRFPKSITTLELGGLKYYSPEDILGMEMFSSFTHVVELRLLLCNTDFVEEVFSFLLFELHGGNILFPELTSMEIVFYEDKKGELPYPVFSLAAGKKLARMLQSRVRLVEEFTLTVEWACLTQNWDDEVWAGLRELEWDGLSLTIIENGHPIAI